MSAPWRITAGRPPDGPPSSPWMVPFAAVVDQWHAGAPSSSTSGSTGAPVLHRFTPDAVRASATATARYFGLQGRVSTWSALPAQGTGGRMAVWRALALGWDLTVTEPAAAPSVPRDTDNRYDFAVATPMQARHLLDSGQLDRFRQLLLGGAPLDPALEAELLDSGGHSGCRIHLGFGMTETLTHIAVRPLGEDAFRLLEGVDLSLEPEGAMVIDAPGRGVRHWRSQDAAEWTTNGDTRAFRWLGRIDDAMNSGGLKVHPHVLEQEITRTAGRLLDGRRWYVAGRPDPALGDRITLVVEGPPDGDLGKQVLDACSGIGIERPRAVEFVDAFRETTTGKVVRH